jgi:hypothetical protein
LAIRISVGASKMSKQEYHISTSTLAKLSHVRDNYHAHGTSIRDQYSTLDHQAKERTAQVGG